MLSREPIRRTPFVSSPSLSPSPLPLPSSPFISSRFISSRFISSRWAPFSIALLDFVFSAALFVASKQSWDALIPQHFLFRSSLLDVLMILVLRLLFLSLISPGKYVSSQLFYVQSIHLGLFVYIVIKATSYINDASDVLLMIFFIHSSLSPLVLFILCRYICTRWKIRVEFVPTAPTERTTTPICSIESLESWLSDQSATSLTDNRSHPTEPPRSPYWRSGANTLSSQPPNVAPLSASADQMIKVVARFMSEGVRSSPMGWHFISEEDGIHTFAKWLPPISTALPSLGHSYEASTLSGPLIPVVRSIAVVNARPVEVYEIMQRLRLEWDLLVGVADGERLVIQHMQTIDSDTDVVRLRFALSGPRITTLIQPDLRELFMVRKWWRSEDDCTFAYGQCSVPGFRPQSRSPHVEAHMHFGGCIIQEFPKSDDSTNIGVVPQTKTSGRRLDASIVTFFYQMDLRGWLSGSFADRFLLHQPTHLWHLRHAIWKKHTHASPELISPRASVTTATTARRKKRRDTSGSMTNIPSRDDSNLPSDSTNRGTGTASISISSRPGSVRTLVNVASPMTPSPLALFSDSGRKELSDETGQTNTGNHPSGLNPANTAHPAHPESAHASNSSKVLVAKQTTEITPGSAADQQRLNQPQRSPLFTARSPETASPPIGPESHVGSAILSSPLRLSDNSSSDDEHFQTPTESVPHLSSS